MIAENEAAEPRNHGDRPEDTEHEDSRVALERLALLPPSRERRPVVADLQYFAHGDQDETEDNDGNLKDKHELNHPARRGAQLEILTHDD